MPVKLIGGTASRLVVNSGAEIDATSLIATAHLHTGGLNSGGSLTTL